MIKQRKTSQYPDEKSGTGKIEMAKRIQWTDEVDFGKRMAKLRKAAGYTQRELAAVLGISNRMVAYYETQANHPPGGLLPKLAEALGISADELLATESSGTQKRLKDIRLQRCFEEADQLPAKQRRQILEFVEALVEREKLRNGTSG